MDISSIECSLLNRALSKYSGVYNNRKALFTAAKALSDRFTKSRHEPFENYLSIPKHRAAYLLHFTITNIEKIHFCLGQLTFPNKPKRLKILDLGCGTGAGILACVSFYDNLSLELAGIDKNRAILDDASSIFRSVSSGRQSLRLVSAEIRARGLRGIVGNERFDIIIAANLLNELPNKGEPSRLCKHLIAEHLADFGYLIIIDPALRETSRSLMQIHDRLLTRKDASVFSPCLHQNCCPMLVGNQRDWCHAYIEWKMSDLIREMDEIVGTDHTCLKMAYMIFQRFGGPPRAVPEHFHRVVSSHLVSKGKNEVFLCGKDGALRRIRRLDRNSSALNSDFDNAKRGDIVIWAGNEDVDKTDVFKKMASSQMPRTPNLCP